MSQVSTHPDGGKNPADRRVFARQPVRSLAYVELGEGNGGIVLNVSEGGIAVQAVMSLMSEDLPCVRLQLSHSKKTIEAKGRVAWTSGLRKLAGVEFVDLSPEARALLREWVALEAPAAPSAEEEGEASSEGVEEKEAPAAKALQSEAVDFVPELLPSPVKPAAKFAEPHDSPPIKSDREPPTRQSPPNFRAPAVAAAKAMAEPTASDPERLRRTYMVSRTSAESWPISSEPSEDAAPENAAAGRNPAEDPTSVPADRFGFKPIRPVTTLPLPPTPERRWKLPVVVGIFAVVSIAAGWFAGHGALHWDSSKGSGDVSTETPPAESSAASPASAPGSNISDIEVVDSNNQRWLVPMHGPLESLRTPAPRSAESVLEHNLSSKMTLGVELAAPVSPQSNAAQVPDRMNPPVVPPPAGAPDDVLPSAAGEDSRSVPSIPAPTVFPSATPAPSDSTRPGTASPEDASRSSSLQSGGLVHRVEPVYPPSALAQRIEGTVTLYAVIDASGAVKSLKPLSGPPSLVPAAVAAVRQWRYSPSLLSGRPIETERQITIEFRLSK